MQKFQVAYIGLSTLFGKTSSLLLKQCPYIKYLKLYDDKNIGPALDIADICSNCKVRAFLGKDELNNALNGADIVIIGDEANEHETSDEKVFVDAAGKVVTYAQAISKSAPEAIVILAASPLNLLFPLLTKALTDRGTYNCDKVFGCTAADSLCAKCILASHLTIDPHQVVLPVVGGSSEESRIPLLSRAKPNVTFTKETMNNIIDSIKKRNKNIREVKGMSESINRAYANLKFLDSVFAGLRGEHNVTDIAMSKTDLVSGVEYFSLPVVLGTNGICSRYKLPKLTNSEEQMLAEAIESIKKDVNKATLYLEGKSSSKLEKKTFYEKYEDKPSKDKLILNMNVANIPVKGSIKSNNSISKPKENLNKNLSNPHEFSTIDVLSSPEKSVIGWSADGKPILNYFSPEDFTGKSIRINSRITEELDFSQNIQPLSELMRLEFNKKCFKQTCETILSNPVKKVNKKNKNNLSKPNQVQLKHLESAWQHLTDKHIKETSSCDIIGRFKNREKLDYRYDSKSSRTSDEVWNKGLENKLRVLQRLNYLKQPSLLSANYYGKLDASPSSVACLSAASTSSSERNINDPSYRQIFCENNTRKEMTEKSVNIQNEKDCIPFISLRSKSRGKDLEQSENTAQIVQEKKMFDEKREMKNNANEKKEVKDNANEKKEMKVNANEKKEMKDKADGKKEMTNNTNEKKEMKNNANEKKEMKVNANEKKEMKVNANEKKEMKVNANEKKEMKDNANEKMEVKDNVNKKNEMKVYANEKMEVKDNVNKKNEMNVYANEKMEVKDNVNKKNEMKVYANEKKEMKNNVNEKKETKSNYLKSEPDYFNEFSGKQKNAAQRKKEDETESSDSAKQTKTDNNNNKQSEKVLNKNDLMKYCASKTVDNQRKPNIFKKEATSTNDLQVRDPHTSSPSKRNLPYTFENHKQKGNYLIKPNNETLSEIDDKILNLDKNIRMENGIFPDNTAKSGNSEGKIRRMDLILNKNKINDTESKCNSVEPSLSENNNPFSFPDDKKLNIDKSIAVNQKGECSTIKDMNKAELRRLDVLLSANKKQSYEKDKKVLRKKTILRKLSQLKYNQRCTFKYGEALSKENDEVEKLLSEKFTANTQQTQEKEPKCKTCFKHYHNVLKKSKGSESLTEDKFQKETKSNSQRKIKKLLQPNKFHIKPSRDENMTYFEQKLNSLMENNSENINKTENLENIQILPEPNEFNLSSSVKQSRDENSIYFEQKLNPSIENNSENINKTENLENIQILPEPNKFNLSSSVKQSRDENSTNFERKLNPSIENNSEYLIKTESLENKSNKFSSSSSSKQLRKENVKSSESKSNSVEIVKDDKAIETLPQNKKINLFDALDEISKTDPITNRVSTAFENIPLKDEVKENLKSVKDKTSLTINEARPLSRKFSYVYRSPCSKFSACRKCVNKIKNNKFQVTASTHDRKEIVPFVKNSKPSTSVPVKKKLSDKFLEMPVLCRSILDTALNANISNIKSFKPHFRTKFQLLNAQNSKLSQRLVKNGMWSVKYDYKSVEKKNDSTPTELFNEQKDNFFKNKSSTKDTPKPHIVKSLQETTKISKKYNKKVKNGMWSVKYDYKTVEKKNDSTPTESFNEQKDNFFKNKSSTKDTPKPHIVKSLEETTKISKKYDKNWFLGKIAHKQFEKRKESVSKLMPKVDNGSPTLYQNLSLKKTFLKKVIQNHKSASKVGTKIQYRKSVKRKKRKESMYDICVGTLSETPSKTSGIYRAALIESLNTTNVLKHSSPDRNEEPNFSNSLSPEKSIIKTSVAFAPKEHTSQYVFDNLPLNEYNKENNFPSLRHFLS